MENFQFQRENTDWDRNFLLELIEFYHFEVDSNYSKVKVTISFISHILREIMGYG